LRGFDSINRKWLCNKKLRRKTAIIIGIDPGKSGFFCAMAEDGTIVSTDKMPVDADGICRVGVSELYRKYQGMVDFDEPVNVFIERIFTRPTDAISQPVIKGMAGLLNVAQAYLEASDGGYATIEHLDALRAVSARLVADLKGQDLNRIRPDGRVGMLNYAKGAGILQCCAMIGWPVTEVSPRTWMKVMKDGVPGALSPKEQSLYAAKALWPHLFDGKKPSDGLCEAVLISEYGRRTLMRASA
jgi:hypothetical protein